MRCKRCGDEIPPDSPEYELTLNEWSDSGSSLNAVTLHVCDSCAEQIGEMLEAFRDMAYVTKDKA